MSRALWGKAKVEVYALKVEILSLHQQGQNLEEAFNGLSDRLTISKRAFKRHASIIIKSKSQPPGSISQRASTRLVNGALSVTTPENHTPAATSPSSPPTRSFDHNPDSSEEMAVKFWDGEEPMDEPVAVPTDDSTNS